MCVLQSRKPLYQVCRVSGKDGPARTPFSVELQLGFLLLCTACSIILTPAQVCVAYIVRMLNTMLSLTNSSVWDCRAVGIMLPGSDKGHEVPRNTAELEHTWHRSIQQLQQRLKASHSDVGVVHCLMPCNLVTARSAHLLQRAVQVVDKMEVRMDFFAAVAHGSGNWRAQRAGCRLQNRPGRSFCGLCATARQHLAQRARHIRQLRLEALVRGSCCRTTTSTNNSVSWSTTFVLFGQQPHPFAL